MASAAPAGTFGAHRRRQLLGGAAVALSVAAAVFWLAFDGGTYDAAGRTSAAVLVWWAVGLGAIAGIWPRARIDAAALAAVGLLAALAVWTGASAAWAPSDEDVVTELGRTTLYLGVYVLALVAGTWSSAARWADGLALGTVGIVGVALVARFVPGSFELSELERVADDIRLSFPVNYWNALAVLVALAVPLLLRTAVSAPSLLVRSLAVAPLPAIAAVLYLASSRGGFLAAAIGASAFVVLSGRAPAALASLAVGVAGAVVVVAYLAGDSRVVTAGRDAAHGRDLAFIVACCGIAALVHGAASRLVPLETRTPRWIPPAALAVAAAVVTVAFASGEPQERFQQFKQPPAPLAQEDLVRAHLTSTSGTWRWQAWSAAVDEFREAPLAGRGAGTFEAWWTQRGLGPVIRDAHSLYLELLGELGLVGLVLLVGALAAALAPARGRFVGTGIDRVVAASLVALAVAFLVAAGIDWMWESTAVAAVGFVALGLLGRRADVAGTGETGGRGRLAAAAVGVAAVMLAAAHSLALFQERELQESRAAVARGDGDEALAAAARARSLAPWAAAPRLQLALVQEQLGQLAPARESVREAARRDRENWRPWLVAARLETKLGRPQAAQAALTRARELNPRSRVLGPG